MRDSLNTLKGAIEKLRRGAEGDFKQALIIADQATETIMRNYLVFVHDENPPYDYPSLLKRAAKKARVPLEIVDEIETFRLIRDVFFITT